MKMKRKKFLSLQSIIHLFERHQKQGSAQTSSLAKKASGWKKSEVKSNNTFLKKKVKEYQLIAKQLLINTSLM